MAAPLTFQGGERITLGHTQSVSYTYMDVNSVDGDVEKPRAVLQDRDALEIGQRPADL